MLLIVNRYMLATVLLLGFVIAKVDAEIQCYACNSYLNQCGEKVDNSRGTLFRSRCAGRCFARQGEDNAIYRGCFDGFDDVPTLIDTYVGCRNQTWNNRQLLWCLCDTNLCNGDDLHTISRANPPLPPPPAQVVYPGRATAGFRPLPPPPPQFAGPYVNTAPLRGGESSPQRPVLERDAAAETTDKVERKIATPVNDADSETSLKATSNRNVAKSAWFQGEEHDLDREQEPTARQLNAEPIYYLPESVLQRGPYIWTPDERPPYIVERVIAEPPRQKTLSTDDYFLDNGYRNGDIDNSFNNGHKDVMHYEEYHHDMHPIAQEARADVGDGQAWWATSIENIVNKGKHSRYDGSTEWNPEYVDDVEHRDARPQLPSNGVGASSNHQYRDMSPTSQDFWSSKKEKHVIKRIDDHVMNGESNYDKQGDYDVNNDQTGSQYNAYRTLDEQSDYGKYMQREPAVEKSANSNSLNYYGTKLDEPLEDEEKRSSMMDEARCTSDAGYHLHPSDCSLYYVCIIHHSGLIPIVMRCPVGLFWDDRVKLCVISSTTCSKQAGAGTSSTDSIPKAGNSRHDQREGAASSSRDNQRELEFIYRW